ncbi:MAG: BMP family ABC transporter substrate-binding protein [Spirochaetaceae bacterium]|jgi:basic membrane protein A|nr:BMP family ABC transporter substrate-binding protein [Spirochaetaceae bacterium]
MKRWGSFCCALALVLTLTGCSPKDARNAKKDGVNKACFITSTARGNEFIDLIWSGLVQLEKEGWEIKCIETFETAEQTEQIRAMLEEGYDLVYTQGDDVLQSVLDLQDEIESSYPDAQFFFLDTYNVTNMPGTTSVTIDPFESCFIAGFVAARTSKSGEVGVMMPLDTPIMRRFEYGYYAGVDYANNGTRVIRAYTTDWMDTTKGYEATKALAANTNIDVLIHCAYISGYGVIQACADLGLPCIGVDDWQGDISPIVFWSAIKSMDVAVIKTAQAWLAGEEFPPAMEYALADGGYAYYDPDLANLSADLAAEVVALKDDIISGKVDVFAGKYQEYRLTEND